MSNTGKPTAQQPFTRFKWLPPETEMAPVWSCKMRLVCSSFEEYNSDQTGLQLELRAGRTLATKGVKKVEVVVQRKNALTHSLTLQPMISSAGQLQLPLFVCFQDWKAPQCFYRELQEFTHLRCEHSKSGLMTNEAILLVDSWPGYKMAQEEFGGPEKIDFLTIPPRTTGQLQPLDVFFNRQLKAFHRQLTELLCRLKPEFVVAVRKNLASMLNLLAWQQNNRLFQPK
ncbi:hypothetical protein L596_018241 [Steinernema carpocapsae]|uniref:DDE-1 domain-containing protein n=1 Tax=Steinernema carpocapsae TaxID=34508 RepID=A0A4U5N435_STECR|nr:hypothetical protein L596_018241 [Steinernema carpocapsae]